MSAAVAKLGHKVSIYATDSGGVPSYLDRFKNDNIEINIFPVQFPKSWARSRPMAVALRRAIPKADIVHIHSLYLYHNLVAGRICKRSKVPYIVRPHGTLDPYLYHHHRFRKFIMEIFFQNKVLRNAAAIHFTTEEESHLAKPYVQGTPGFIVSNGVNIEDYDSNTSIDSFRAQFPETAQKRIVLFLGRLNFKKGLDILLPAFADVARQYPDLHLVIAGPDDGMEKKVRDWIDNLGLIDDTTLTGMLTGKDIVAAYKSADVFVLPSYTENFGIAVVEAMACSIPVLISNRVNIWREVSEARAGLISEANIESFTKSLSLALRESTDLIAMGERAKILATTQYNWSSVGKSLEKVYSSIIENSALEAN